MRVAFTKILLTSSPIFYSFEKLLFIIAVLSIKELDSGYYIVILFKFYYQYSHSLGMNISYITLLTKNDMKRQHITIYTIVIILSLSFQVRLPTII